MALTIETAMNVIAAKLQNRLFTSASIGVLPLALPASLNGHLYRQFLFFTCSQSSPSGTVVDLVGRQKPKDLSM